MNNEGAMTTQHEGLPVSGYRPQSTHTVDLVNRNKEIEERVLRLLDDLAKEAPGAVDPGWFATGRTDIEKGFMSINRAIFQPARARLPEDKV